MVNFRATGEPMLTPDGGFDVQAYIRALTIEVEMADIEQRVLRDVQEDRL